MNYQATFVQLSQKAPFSKSIKLLTKYENALGILTRENRLLIIFVKCRPEGMVVSKMFQIHPVNTISNWFLSFTPSVTFIRVEAWHETD